MYMFIDVYVYVSTVYMLCSPILGEIKNLSIYVKTLALASLVRVYMCRLTVLSIQRETTLIGLHASWNIDSVPLY